MSRKKNTESFLTVSFHFLSHTLQGSPLPLQTPRHPADSIATWKGAKGLSSEWEHISLSSDIAASTYTG